jgi:hypothetical protein
MVNLKLPKDETTRNLLSDQTRDRLAQYFLYLVVFTSINTLLATCNAISLQNVATRRQTQVQLINGEVIMTTERDANFRSPEVMKSFLRQWIVMAWNWDVRIDPKTNDPGIKIASGRIPTPSWYATTLLRQGLDDAVGKEMVKAIPSGVLDGSVTSATVINSMSHPRPVPGVNGQWDIDVVATRYVSRRGGTRERVALNKTYRLAATDWPPPNIGRLSEEVRMLLYGLRTPGLQIIDIKHYTPS